MNVSPAQCLAPGARLNGVCCTGEELPLEVFPLGSGQKVIFITNIYQDMCQALCHLTS